MKLDKEKVARWYKQGLWTTAMVQKAVEKGGLTAEQASDILRKEESV